MGVKAHRGRLLVDEFDFSLDTFSASLQVTAAALESSNWQSAAVQYLSLIADSKLTLSGYYTGYAAGDIYREVYARLGTESACRVAWLLNTTALGNPAYVLDSAWGDNITVDVPVDDLLKFSGTFRGTGYGGVVLLDGAVTATGDGTVVDLGATGTTGGTAWLFVRAISGTAVNAAVTVECDTVVGMTTPTDKGTLTFSAVGVYQAAITGTVERYVRVTIDSLGGATGFTAALILCVNDVTQ